MNPFVYPANPHQRRHGPRGYVSYESYRSWLRDEFSFRCVYCLNREQWVVAKGAFAIDHFIPVSIHPGQSTNYDNLLYACVACNLSRGNKVIPNPLQHLLDSTARVDTDGVIVTATPEAQEIVETLYLNDPDYVFRRQRVIALLEVLEQHRPDLHTTWLGYPDDLPDLSRLRPPGGNDRPAGIEHSHFALRRKSELPRTY